MSCLAKKDVGQFVGWLQADNNWGTPGADEHITRIKYAIQRDLRKMSKDDTWGDVLEALLIDVQDQRFWEKLSALLDLELPE
jgi:hypothetical protein